MSDEEPKTLAELQAKKADARRRLWRRGHLEWKFEDGPWAKQMYDFTRARWGASPYLVWFVHRRGWKSSTGIVIGMEECLRVPNTRCALVCKTKDQAQEICDTSMVELLSDCPKDVEPRKIKNEYAYQFQNGSSLRILPLDGKQGVKARGKKFTFILITEAAFIDNIDKILRSRILPTLNDVTGRFVGTIVLESTPPEEPGHPWEEMVEEARAEDRLFYLPLSKNKYANPEFVLKAQKQSGGADSTDYLREYELQFVYGDESTVIPEATLSRMTEGTFVLISPDGTQRLAADAAGAPVSTKESPLPDDLDVEGWRHEPALLPIVRELVYPIESDHYESLDPGGADLTGWLASTYIFEQDILYIEDEITFQNMTTDDFAKKVREHEVKLWGEMPRGKIRRYGDNNNQRLLYDLHVLHKLSFFATAKDNKDAQINQARLMVRDGRLAIHPRCKLLIKTLRVAKRAKQARKGFEHGDDIGHADLLDALLYMIRNVKRRELPKAPTQRQAEAQVRPPPPVAQREPDRQLARALGLGRGLSRFR